MRSGTTVQSRQLGRHLRELRRQSRLSADRVAVDIGLSPATVYRYEAGTSVPRGPDTAAMCDIYGADAETRDALVALAKEAEVPGWWRSYNGAIPRWFDTFVSLEGAASHIRAYESDFIFGLLQTERYAEAIVMLESPPPSAEECRQRVAVRMERQRLLARRDPPRLEVLLGEAALRRAPGPEIMAEQLAQLDRLSRQPHITLRVVPVGALHAGLNCGARFIMLTFPPDRRGAAEEPPLVFADNLTGAAHLDKPAEIAAYDAVWEAVGRVALPPGESRQLIAEHRERCQR